MGKSIMADTVGMDYIQTIPRTNTNGKLDKVALETFWKIGQGGININKEGKRFVNCLANRAVESSQIMKQEKPIFFIYDDKIKIMASALTDEHYRKAIQKGRIVKGNTIEELAEKAGINPFVLVSTIKPESSQ